MTPENPMTRWQQDALTTFRKQQEDYLDSIATWRKSFSDNATAGAVPTPPAAPAWDPAEVMEANRAFMEGIFKQQQDFLNNLTKALAPDSTGK